MGSFLDGDITGNSTAPAGLQTGAFRTGSFLNDEPTTSQTSKTFPAPESYKPPAESPDNPLSFIGGMVAHVITGVPDIIRGLGTLGKVTIEDGWAQAMKLVPGEQSAEKRLEEEGSNWGNIIRAAPHMLQQDYASRYGFHGFEEMKDQLYANPLSYIMDALMVGDFAAKGAEIGGKLGLMSDEAVTAIRGVAPLGEVGKAEQVGAITGKMKLAKPLPTSEFGNLIGGAGKAPGVQTFGLDVAQAGEGIMSVSTSVNPVKRFVQNTILNRVLSRPAEAVKGMMEGDQWARLGIGTADAPATMGQQLAAGKVVDEAITAGRNILKPAAEKWVTSRAARFVAGIGKQSFYGSRNQYVRELRDILVNETGKVGGSDWNLVKEITGTNPWFESLLNGAAVAPTGRPLTGPLAINHGMIPELPIAPEVSAVDAQARQAAYLAVGSHFKDTASRIVADNFNTPHSLIPVGEQSSKAMRFTGLVRDLRDAPSEAIKLAQENGWRMRGVVDYTKDAAQPWNGLHYFFDTAEGHVVEVNIATPELHAAQALHSGIQSHLTAITGQADALSAEQGRILNELMGHGVNPEEVDAAMTGLSAADREAVTTYRNLTKQALNVQEEVRAASTWAKRLWDHPLRKAAGSYGEDEAGLTAQKVDALFNWSSKWNQAKMTKTWRPNWVTEGLKGPYTVGINRAFYPMKLEVFHHIMERSAADLEKLFKTARYGDSEELTAIAAKYLQDFHMLPPDMVHTALYVSDDETLANAALAALKTGEPIRSQRAIGRAAEIGADPTLPAGFEAMRLPIADPEKAARTIVDRLTDKMRMAVLHGDMPESPAAQEAWSWENFAATVPDLPGYYPHIRPATGSAMFYKGAATNLPRTAFQKGFKGYLMESGRVLDDPFKAYGIRAYQQLRHEELIDQFDRLKEFARELDVTEYSLLKAGSLKLGGEVVFSPDFLKEQISLHGEMLDDITRDFMDNGMLYEDAARKALDGLNLKLQESVTAGLTSSKVYALPKHVADAFESQYLANFSPAKMRMFWDKPKDLWISSVLGLNPRWFIYRTMGNIMFAGIKNVNPMRLFGWARHKNNRMIELLLADSEVGGESLMNILGRGYAQSEVTRTGGTFKGMLGDPNSARIRMWGSAGDEFPRLTKWADAVYESRPGQRVSKMANYTTNWVNYMEQAERHGVALSTLAKQTGAHFWDRSLPLWKKAAAEGFDEALVGRMLNDANWTLGNYTTLSPFERDIMRRFIMPFYPFYRHMLKFAARMPFDHPIKSQVLNYINTIDEDIGPHLPEYLRGGVYLGQIGGTPLYWNITHWNPLADLASAESNPTTMMDPRLKILQMAYTGTDEFNRPYESANVYHAPNGQRFIRTSSGWQPFEGIEHPSWLKMIESLYGGPGAQMINPYGFNQPWWKVAAAHGGISLSPFDVAGYQERVRQGEQAATSSTYAREIPYSR